MQITVENLKRICPQYFYHNVTRHLFDFLTQVKTEILRRNNTSSPHIDDSKAASYTGAEYIRTYFNDANEKWQIFQALFKKLESKSEDSYLRIYGNSQRAILLNFKLNDLHFAAGRQRRTTRKNVPRKNHNLINHPNNISK